jgi:hypothetical protein
MLINELAVCCKLTDELSVCCMLINDLDICCKRTDELSVCWLTSSLYVVSMYKGLIMPGLIDDVFLIDIWSPRETWFDSIWWIDRVEPHWQALNHFYLYSFIRHNRTRGPWVYSNWFEFDSSTALTTMNSTHSSFHSLNLQTYRGLLLINLSSSSVLLHLLLSEV